MIVIFFNASGIDFGNFLNAHLKSKILSPNYVTSTICEHLDNFILSTVEGVGTGSHVEMAFIFITNICLRYHKQYCQVKPTLELIINMLYLTYYGEKHNAYL